MSDVELLRLGATKVVKGVAYVQSMVPVGEAANDVEPHGDLEVFQCGGVIHAPAEADDTGSAEAIGITGVPGKSTVIIGMRDTRSADLVGKLGPGDSSLVSTGKGAVAQVQVKSKKRQVVLATKDSQNRSMAVVLDGKNDKVQIAALGAMFEIDKKGNLSITAGGASFMMQDGTIYLVGKVVLGGMSPTLTMVAGASGPAAVAVPGVFAGA